MAKITKAKIIARESTKSSLKEEIPMINNLIASAAKAGESFVLIDITSYSKATERLLEKAGYDIERDRISWFHEIVKIIKDEEELKKISENEANVEVISIEKVAKVSMI